MQREAKLDENGHEIVSNVPMEPPLGYKKQPSMVEHIRNMVKSEMLRREVQEAGAETFEEADDFDIADDPVDPSTPFEEVFEPAAPVPPPTPAPTAGVATPPAAVPSSTVPAAAAPVPPVDPPTAA